MQNNIKEEKNNNDEKTVSQLMVFAVCTFQWIRVKFVGL